MMEKRGLKVKKKGCRMLSGGSTPKDVHVLKRLPMF